MKKYLEFIKLLYNFVTVSNGIVERINGTIKNNTIKIKQYKNKDEMQSDLLKFLMYYILYNRRHRSLRKELNVKTPFEAIEKWFKIKPKIFKENPLRFKNKVLILHTSYHKQHCLTIILFQKVG